MVGILKIDILLGVCNLSALKLLSKIVFIYLFIFFFFFFAIPTNIDYFFSNNNCNCEIYKTKNNFLYRL